MSQRIEKFYQDNQQTMAQRIDFVYQYIYHVKFQQIREQNRLNELQYPKIKDQQKPGLQFLKESIKPLNSPFLQQIVIRSEINEIIQNNQQIYYQTMEENQKVANYLNRHWDREIEFTKDHHAEKFSKIPKIQKFHKAPEVLIDELLSQELEFNNKSSRIQEIAKLDQQQDEMINNLIEIKQNHNPNHQLCDTMKYLADRINPIPVTSEEFFQCADLETKFKTTVLQDFIEQDSFPLEQKERVDLLQYPDFHYQIHPFSRNLQISRDKVLEQSKARCRNINMKQDIAMEHTKTNFNDLKNLIGDYIHPEDLKIINEEQSDPSIIRPFLEKFSYMPQEKEIYTKIADSIHLQDFAQIQKLKELLYWKINLLKSKRPSQSFSCNVNQNEIIESFKTPLDYFLQDYFEILNLKEDSEFLPHDDFFLNVKKHIQEAFKNKHYQLLEIIIKPSKLYQQYTSDKEAVNEGPFKRETFSSELDSYSENDNQQNIPSILIIPSTEQKRSFSFNRQIKFDDEQTPQSRDRSAQKTKNPNQKKNSFLQNQDANQIIQTLKYDQTDEKQTTSDQDKAPQTIFQKQEQRDQLLAILFEKLENLNELQDEKIQNVSKLELAYVFLDSYRLEVEEKEAENKRLREEEQQQLEEDEDQQKALFKQKYEILWEKGTKKQLQQNGIAESRIKQLKNSEKQTKTNSNEPVSFINEKLKIIERRQAILNYIEEMCRQYAHNSSISFQSRPEERTDLTISQLRNTPLSGEMEQNQPLSARTVDRNVISDDRPYQEKIAIVDKDQLRQEKFEELMRLDENQYHVMGYLEEKIANFQFFKKLYTKPIVYGETENPLFVRDQFQQLLFLQNINILHILLSSDQIFSYKNDSSEELKFQANQIINNIRNIQDEVIEGQYKKRIILQIYANELLQFLKESDELGFHSGMALDQQENYSDPNDIDENSGIKKLNQWDYLYEQGMIKLAEKQNRKIQEQRMQISRPPLKQDTSEILENLNIQDLGRDILYIRKKLESREFLNEISSEDEQKSITYYLIDSLERKLLQLMKISFQIDRFQERSQSQIETQEIFQFLEGVCQNNSYDLFDLITQNFKGFEIFKFFSQHYLYYLINYEQIFSNISSDQ